MKCYFSEVSQNAKFGSVNIFLPQLNAMFTEPSSRNTLLTQLLTRCGKSYVPENSPYLIYWLLPNPSSILARE